MAPASFHVFLSHNSADKPAVEELARRLKADGLESWLDKWHLIPGEPWQQALEKALADSMSVAVFVGPSGLGPWQNEEMRVALSKRVSESDGKFRVIPVLLPGGVREERSRLPAFLIASTWVEFRKNLDEEEAYHRLKSGILGRPPGLGVGEAIYEGQCPYRGLQAFQPEHAQFFFGRESRVEWLLNAIRPASELDASGAHRENRFLAIVGASGSGKSSLARAGLVPALQKGRLEGSESWPIIIFRPGHDPLESMATALAGHPKFGSRIGDVGDLISKLASDETRLHLTTRVAMAGEPETQRVVLLIDQFEEIFTLHSEDMSGTRASRSFRDVSHTDPANLRRQAFIDNLIYAAGITNGKTIVVLTMRADFYSKCAAHPHLAASLTGHQELVGPMTQDELREVIERPAQLVGLELERGLTEVLLTEMEDQPAALPLLQHALWELWQRREGRHLTLSAYKAIGGLEGALEQQADAAYDRMTPDEREACRRIFLRLTQPGEGSEDTKRRVPLSQLGDSRTTLSVINRLATIRLITMEQDSFVEVSHEALIRSWPKLRGWIEADREALRTQHRLTEAAAEWDSSQRDPGYLYQGARLAEADEWSKTPEADLTLLERQFLAACLEQRDRGVQEEADRRAREMETLRKLAESERQCASDQAIAARRSRWQTRAALTFAIAALAAFLWAARAQRHAERNARQTEEARKEIAEILASNMCERIHEFPSSFGIGEFSNFWQIAGLPHDHEPLRMRLLTLGFEKPHFIGRLINRAPNVALSIVGLDLERREHALQETILPVLKDPTASTAKILAAVRLGIALKVEGADFAEQAIRSLTNAIVNATDDQVLDGLTADLLSAVRSMPVAESQKAILPIVDAMERTNDARVLRRLCDAVNALPGQMATDDGHRVGDRLLAVMEKERQPERIRELSDSLTSLPKDLKKINAPRGVRYIMKAIEGTRRIEVQDSLVAAVRTASERLNPDECRTISDELLGTMLRTRDSETAQVYARCLRAVALHLSETDADKAIAILLQGMEATEEADPLKELCAGLARLKGKFTEANRRSATGRLLKLMSTQASSRDLRVLAECLGTVPWRLSGESTQRAKSQLITLFVNPDVTPPDLVELANGLTALPAELNQDECLQLYRAIMAALEKVPRAESIREIGLSLETLGGKLTAANSAAVADIVLSAMETSRDEEKLRALTRGVRGMKKVIDPAKVTKAYEIVNGKLRDPKLLPIDICLLVECMAILPDDIPEAIADESIRRTLKILEITENSEIIQLVVDNLGLIGSDVSAPVGHQAIVQILERIRTTGETSLLRVLALGLASVANRLEIVNKFTDSDAPEVVNTLTLAMDITTDPIALFSLAEAIEKIAPKLSIDEEIGRTMTNRVIEQNLRTIESVRNPKLIGQLARIWQVMAGRMSPQQMHEAFEKILKVNSSMANAEVRPPLCRAAVALATSTESSHAANALWHLLSALRSDHNKQVLEIMLDGIEKMAPRVPEEDVARAKASILSTTGDRARINEQVLSRLIQSLGKLPKGVETSELVELLKSPFCTGAAQETVLRMIESKTKLQFDGNPWKLVASAKEAGLEPMLFRQTVRQPDPLGTSHTSHGDEYGEPHHH